MGGVYPSGGPVARRAGASRAEPGLAGAGAEEPPERCDLVAGDFLELATKLGA